MKIAALTKKSVWTWSIGGVTLLVVLFWLLGWLLSEEPQPVALNTAIQQTAAELEVEPVKGFATSTAVIESLSTLLNKRGGYMSNDILPPTVWLDNIPAWEFGVVQMTRDMLLALRNDFSRSQSQSVENPNLVVAQPAMNIDHTSWFAPTAENEYKTVINEVKQYRLALLDSSDHSAQFYARSDNLRRYMQELEKRLGSLSRRLSASVARVEPDLALAGDAVAVQSTASLQAIRQKTSWWQIDNTFYEARGASWAILNFLKAVEIDFAEVLSNKNALISLQQIINELESSLQPVSSPMILNGSGFGLLANHSLVMANYLSRANAALIDLRNLLAEG
ncbi:DUF2333 family protein [Idiomarina seosinensis]|uniref:DUF2333 family protein n=1 Tax=Idiomarina seosinensis TaxID=281739 RepID=UPI0038504AF0